LGQENFVLNKEDALDLARWPNNEDGLPFTIDSRRNSGGSGSNVVNGAFLTSNQIPNIDWTGGSVFFYGDKPGSGWIAWKSFITSSSNGRVNFVLDKSPTWIRTFHAPADGGDFYLEGAKGALDYQNEWWFNTNTNELFVQLPGGVAPVDGEVKMRRRLKTIDLNSRSFIEVRDLAVFGGAIEIKNNANNNKLFQVSSFYGNHTQGIFRGFNAEKPSLEISNSNNNVIERCEIAFSAATGVRLGGSFNTLKNNYIHDFNYLGSYDAPVVARGLNDCKLIQNTIFHGGRDGINCNGTRNEIAYNDVSRSNLIADDCALFYAVGRQLSTEIHHNWFHDVASRGSKKKAAGIYLDVDAEGFSVHHNVIWNTEWAGVQQNWDCKDNNIFNNTIWDNSEVMGAWHKDGTSFTNINVWNNLSNDDNWEPQSNKQNNLSMLSGANPFLDFSGKDFRLRAGTQPIDYGREIAGITDGYVGAAPDVGAYELGDDWVAGIDWDPQVGPTGNGCYELPGEDCTATCQTPLIWYADVDNDGLGDPNDTTTSCAQPSGYVDNDSDLCPRDELNTCTILHNVNSRIEAEEYTSQQGIQREETTDVGGGMNIGFIQNGEKTVYRTMVSRGGSYSIKIRVASNDTDPGIIRVSSDQPGVTPVDVAAIYTGGWQVWETVTSSAEINLTEGIHLLSFEFIGTYPLYNINWIEFEGSLGVNDINQNNKFIAYPNPVKHTFYLQGEIKNTKFGVYDLTGRLISRHEASSNILEISLRDLSSAVYFVRALKSGYTVKIIKD